MRLPLAAILLLPVVSSCGSNDGGSGQGGASTMFHGWAVSAGGAPNLSEFAAEVAVFPGGSSVVVGMLSEATFGEGEPNETTLSSAPLGREIFVARYAANGTLSWARNDGGPGIDWVLDVDVVSDGSCLVTGIYNDGAVFGSGEPAETTLHTESVDHGGMFIARYAADGSLSWAVSASGDAFSGAVGLGALADGSCVVAGEFSGSLTLGAGEPNEATLETTGVDSLFVARYAADGTLVWARLGACSEDVSPYGLDTLADGSSLVTGWFTGSLSLGPGPGRAPVEVTAAGNDAFLLRYDGDGVPQWVKAVHGVVTGEGAVRSQDVAALLDGTAAITGSFYGAATFGEGEPNEVTLASDGPWTDAFFARFGASGNLLWVERAGGPSGDVGYGITAHDDGSLFVAGHFIADATFGVGETHETVLHSAGSLDVFIARLFPDGRLRWARRAGGVEIDEARGIAVRPDHSTVTWGTYWGPAEFGGILGETLTSNGGGDLFLACYGPNGEF